MKAKTLCTLLGALVLGSCGGDYPTISRKADAGNSNPDAGTAVQCIYQEPTSCSGSLADYPKPFDNNSVLVFGAMAPVEDNVALVDIASGIPCNNNGSPCGLPAVIKDTEVADIRRYNAISVGNPDVNKITAELLGLPFPTYMSSLCWMKTEAGEEEAIIQLVDNGDKQALIVYGTNSSAIRRAGTVLKNYAAFNGTLKGCSVAIKGTSMGD